MTKIFASLALFISLFSITACSNSEKEFAAELQLLDSLEARLNQARSWMVLDADEINSRYKLMEENHTFFKTHFKDTVTLELALALDQYKGIIPIYEGFVEHHKAVEEELSALDKQCKDLRHSLLNGEVNRKDFKMYYAKESDDIKQLSEHVNTIFKKVVEVEPMYKRCAPVVNAKVESLRRSTQ
jgi:hypothetical protein